MGNYLVIIAHDTSCAPESLSDYGDAKDNVPASLVVVDLRDNSVESAGFERKWEKGQFDYIDEYSLTKYNDNQIIKIGGKDGFGLVKYQMLMITITSWKPLQFKTEEIRQGKGGTYFSPEFKEHTAQIYNDCLYVYSGEYKKQENAEDNVWCFDLQSKIWKQCKTTGEGPGAQIAASSFIYQDNLYVYGGYASSLPMSSPEDISFLNLSTMKWNRIQKQGFPNDIIDLQDITHNSGNNLYKGSLLILGDRRTGDNQHKFGRERSQDVLCCWSIESNSWSTFDIEEMRFRSEIPENLVVYNNLLLSCGTDDKQNLGMAILNLDNFPSLNSKSAEEKHVADLFMSQEKSDITFKINDQTIPAHKQILIQKSKYFANLFNSGMAESRQDLIEITDCDYVVFQEFLRWIYCEELKLDVQLALKLLPLADKYVQNNLRDKCINILTHNINAQNIYSIFDYACQEDLSYVKSWCGKFWNNNINLKDLPQLMKYLDQKPKTKDLIGPIDTAITAIIKNFSQICQKYKQNIQVYENFLVNMIDIHTISKLSNFVFGDSSANKSQKQFSYKQESFSDDMSEEEDEDEEEENDLSEGISKVPASKSETSKLREELLKFVPANFAEIKAKKINQSFSNTFLTEVLSYEIENPIKYTKTKGVIEEEENDQKKEN